MTSESGKKKNVIWFMVDQLRRDALGIYGDPNVSTPNLDNMGRLGVHFTKAVGGFPLCCPSRASFLAGTYPQNNGVIGHEFPLDPEKPLISDVFNEAGYDTIYYGKWHLDGFHESEKDIATYHTIKRERRGRFATFVGYENNNSPFNTWVHGHDNDREVDHYRLPGYETEALTDLALEKIRHYGKLRNTKEEKPFFMVVSVQPPHDPYVAPTKQLAKHKTSEIKFRENVPPYEKIRKQAAQDLVGYYGAIEEIDKQVGRLMDELEKNGLSLDTHVVFFSDHGDMHGSHGMFRKTNPYEEAVGVPVIIGGGIPYAYHSQGIGPVDTPMNHVDIAPTTLGLCGLSIPAWMEGVDYSGYRLRNRTISEEKDSVYIQSIVPSMHGDSIDKPWRGVITNDGYKYVCLENMEWLLFDLNSDPYELVNLVHNSIYTNKRKELNQRLAKWVRDTNDEFLLPEVK